MVYGVRDIACAADRFENAAVDLVMTKPEGQRAGCRSARAADQS